ncbi:MAG: DUF4143 domain-containing protein [Candidatus Nitrosopolaris sp.]
MKDWQKGIKRLWDQGRLTRCTVIATGSHMIDLKMSNEKLPGRRGETIDSYDKIMLPMKFSEYVSCIDGDLSHYIEENLRHEQSRLDIFKMLLGSQIDNRLDGLQAYLPNLNQYLLDYLVTGGIPKVVDVYIKNGSIREEIYTTYLNVILGDLNSLHRNEKIFRQLVGNIIKNISWPVSWRSLLKDTDIGSPTTVIEYISMLEDMFVLSTFYQYHSEKKKPLFEKEKKIHFRDVFFLHALNAWINATSSFEVSQSFIENNQGPLVEGVVGDHLIRFAFAVSPKKQIFQYSNFLYYWKYGKQQEVDYVLNDGITLEIPIEVKFQNTITNRDSDGIINFKKLVHAKSALLLSKDQLNVSKEFVKIPVSMLLLLV